MRFVEGGFRQTVSSGADFDEGTPKLWTCARTSHKCSHSRRFSCFLEIVRVHSFEVYEHDVPKSKSLGRIRQARWFLCLSGIWSLRGWALSCHLALDLLCQEMQEDCQESPPLQCTEVSPTVTIAVTVWRGGWWEILERGVAEFSKEVR